MGVPSIRVGRDLPTMPPGPQRLSERFSSAVDIGSGHQYVWLWRRPFNWPEERAWNAATDGLFPDDVYCIIEQHQRRDDPDTLCEGEVHLRHPYDHTVGAVWKVNSWDPLDIDPSVLCPVCGSHGYIRSGKWEDVA